jgi:hypothetical protein
MTFTSSRNSRFFIFPCHMHKLQDQKAERDILRYQTTQWPHMIMFHSIDD